MEPASNELKYVILSETDCDICETYMYFLKYNGNEFAINKLAEQIRDTEESEIYDDVHVFNMDTVNMVSEQTATEMCRIELNNTESFHRKFDGVLTDIDFEINDDDDAMSTLCKIHELLSFGSISEYIDDEDLDMTSLTIDKDIVGNVPSRFKL